MKNLTIVLKRFAFLFFAGVYAFSLQGQTVPDWCGTKPDAQQIEKIKALPHTVQGAGSVAPLKCLNKTLSIALHIITDSLNNPNITLAAIYKGLDTLNHDFAPICLDFKICSIETIYNYKYYNFDQVLETPEVHSIYEVRSVINVYIVNKITPAPEAGFASMGGNYMVLTHGCVTDGKCWSHEM